MRRRRAYIWLAVAVAAVFAAFALAACGDDDDSGSDTSGGSVSVTKIGIAAPEEANDFGWNQQGVESAQAAATNADAEIEISDGIGYENTEPVLRRLAQSDANLIIAQASGYNTIAPKVANEFGVPIIVYDAPDANVPGEVGDIETSSQDGAYLAGVLAANVTQTNTLGIVVSAADSNWYKMAGGYIAGARSVNPDVDFRFAQVGQAAYADAAGGRRVTASVIAAGADVVFGMGNGASFGMLQAVETATPPDGADQVYFIDVIGDKTEIDDQGVLLSSVLWDFTQVFDQAVADIDAGTFGEQGYVLGVENGISLLQTDKAPDSAWEQVNDAQAGIADGSITVPETTTQEEVDALIDG